MCTLMSRKKRFFRQVFVNYNNMLESVRVRTTGRRNNQRSGIQACKQEPLLVGLISRNRTTGNHTTDLRKIHSIRFHHHLQSGRGDLPPPVTAQPHATFQLKRKRFCIHVHTLQEVNNCQSHPLQTSHIRRPSPCGAGRRRPHTDTHTRRNASHYIHTPQYLDGLSHAFKAGPSSRPNSQFPRLLSRTRNER